MLKTVVLLILSVFFSNGIRMIWLRLLSLENISNFCLVAAHIAVIFHLRVIWNSLGWRRNLHLHQLFTPDIQDPLRLRNGNGWKWSGALRCSLVAHACCWNDELLNYVVSKYCSSFTEFLILSWTDTHQK